MLERVGSATLLLVLEVSVLRLLVNVHSQLRKLGIIANYMPNYSLKPWIDTIAEGLVHEWNKAQDAQKPVAAEAIRASPN